MKQLNTSIVRAVAVTLFAFVVVPLGGCGSGTNSSNPGVPGSPTPIGNPPQPVTSGIVLTTYTSPAGTVYDRTHKYLFVSVTKLNRVDVFSTLDYHLVASIPVPAPMGMDISADNTQVIVGSSIPNFFILDTTSLKIVREVPIPVQGVGNVQVVDPTGVALSSSGNLLLIINFINASDGEKLAEWNPTTGQLTYRQDFQSLPTCMASSTDHTKILIGACGINFLGGPGQEVGLYDASSDSFTNFLYGFGYVGGIASNQNATQFAVNVRDSSLVILDKNFNILQEIPSSALGLNVILGSMVYSLDGRYLYLIQANPGAGAAVTVLDTTSFKVVGNASANGAASIYLPQFLQPAIDENNVLFVPLGGSIGVTPTPQTPSAMTPGWRSIAPPQGFSQVSVASPIAGNAPQAAFAVYNAGSASGGTPGRFFIYGEQYAAGGINVTIGGAPARVTDAQPGGNYSSAMVGGLEGVTAQVSPGAEGLTNVAIGTPAGTLTMDHAFNYVGEQVVPVSGTLWQLIYDQRRQQLYISNASANRIEIYSLTAQRLLSPIPAGKTPHGLSLTPDGSLLIAANSGDGTVTIVNPDNPGGAMTIPVGTIGGGQPNEVATTNTGKAIVTYSPDLAEIDLTTHVVTYISDRHIYIPYLLMGTKDGSAVLCDCGTLGLWDSQTSTWAFSALQGGGTFNGAISGDGNILAQGDYILDPQLLITGQLAQWDFLPGPLTLSGGSDMLNSSGSLVYKADLGADAINGTGVQIFDVNHGDLKEWVELPEAIPNNTQHRLTLDDSGRNLYVLTQSGFTAVHFTSVPLSVAYLKPNQGTAAGGTTVTIRGSGFETGCQAYFNDAPAATTFVDSQTLMVVTPKIISGAVQFRVQNPDGQVYSLDNSFSAQ